MWLERAVICANLSVTTIALQSRFLRLLAGTAKQINLAHFTCRNHQRCLSKHYEKLDLHSDIVIEQLGLRLIQKALIYH